MLEESLNILNRPHESATAEYGPACLTAQRNSPCFCSSLRCDCGGKEGEDKTYGTCGSWEKHSKNSEEGLPLAVVRQCVVEHKLFRVANEAMLCKDMEGKRRTSEITGTAGDPPVCSWQPPIL